MRTRDKSKIAFARRLRAEMTPPEARIWVRLRGRTHGDITFRRQHPVGVYVLDFYCARARLAIEVDGRIHDSLPQAQRDEARDAWLSAQGIATYRIAAADIMADPDEMAEGIWLLAKARASNLR